MIKEPDMSPIALDERYKTVIYLIRHGESLGNANGEFLGHTDKDLSQKGYEQAARTAEFLSCEPIDAVYSSDLKRAFNTALPHAKMRNLEVIPSVAMREIYAGEWDGMTYEDIFLKYGRSYTDGWRASFGTFVLPGGESLVGVGRRVFDEVMRIARENVGKRVVIGTHAAAIRSFWATMEGLPPELWATETKFPLNASVSVVYYDSEKLIPGAFSHADHLRDIINEV